MKIIEPILDLGSLSVNTATIDAVDTWAPIGRDLLNYIADPVFDISDNTMAVVSSSDGGNIYIVDLAIGVVTQVSHTAPAQVLNITISPNKLYLYLALRSATPGSELIFHEVVKIIDGSVIYQTSLVSTEKMPLAIDVVGNSIWASDSSYCLIPVQNQIRSVDPITGTSTVLHSATSNSAAISLVETPSHYYMLRTGNTGYDSGVRVYKITLAGAHVADHILATGIMLEYNSVRDDLLVGRSGGYLNGLVVEPGFANLVSLPNLTDDYYISPKSIKVTATHLITRSQSSFPFWNYLLLTDYTLDKSLPELEYTGLAIAEATDYTVVQKNNYGVDLLDSLDAPITQQNPNVITGDKYRYEDNIYDVLLDNNDQPDEGALLAIPSWIDTGKINPLRLFDGKLDSLTTAPDRLLINITPLQLVTGIALFNVKAASIRVTMLDPVEGIVFDTGVISMIDNSGVNNWWSYYFSPYIEKSDFVSLSLPPYIDAMTQVTIEGGGGSVAVGEVVCGRVHNIGDTQFGSGVGILDFSEKEQDQFGNFNIVERKFSKRGEYDVKIPTNSVSGAQRILSKFRATPIVWVGDVNREETIIYGFYRSFDVVLSNPALSDTAISVEGL